jgi:hypothetical protein
MTSAVPGPKINYQGNSKLDREITEEKAAEGVTPKLKKIEGMKVIEKEQTLGRRIKASFGGQNLKSVGLALLMEVVLPKSQDMLMMLIEEGGRRAIYGESSRRSGSSASVIVGSNRARSTNYNGITTSPIISTIRAAGDTALSSRDRSMFDFSGLVIEDREMAEEALERMEAAIEEFGMVTVADFYDSIGVSGTGFTDQKFGWNARAFSTAGIKKVREGWNLDLPTPISIN